ncbi:hypothetical protein ACQJBY_065067 [Aegilops geniculata]
MSPASPPDAKKLPWFEPYARAGFTDLSTVHELPYDHSIMLENLMDPAHVPISHDRTDWTAKREDAQPLAFEVAERTARGFAGHWWRERAAPPQPAPLRGALRAHQHTRVRGQGRQGAVLLGVVPVPAGGAGEVDAARPVRVHGEVAAAEGAAELVLPPERVQGVRAGHGVPVVAERGAAPGEGAHQGALPQPPLLGHLGGRVPAMDGQGRPRHALLLRPQHHLAAARASRRGAGAGTQHAPNPTSRYFRHVVHCKGCRDSVNRYTALKKAFVVLAAVAAAADVLAAMADKQGPSCRFC